jgi:hypothetical protein
MGHEDGKTEVELAAGIPDRNRTVPGNGRTMFGGTMNRKVKRFLSFCPHRAAKYPHDLKQRHGLSAMTAKKSTARYDTWYKDSWFQPEGLRLAAQKLLSLG